MADDYRFERISPKLYPEFIDLVRDSFNTETSLDEVRRLFDTRSFGFEHLGFLAFHSATGQTAAFYGIFPCWVEIDGERILAAQSGSTMTHPDHRRRNLFYLTGERTYELARSEGIAFVYGMPNQLSYRGLIKLGWTHVDNAVRYRFFVPTLPLGLLGKHSRVLRKLHESLFSWVASYRKIRAYPMRSSALEPGGGGSHRSEASLRYKPEDRNHLMLRIGGVDVWINQDRGQLGIGDIDLDDASFDLRRLVRGIKFLAFLTGCSVVRTYMSPGCRLDQEFRAAGYKGTEALPNCVLSLSRDVRPERFKWVYADYDTF